MFLHLQIQSIIAFCLVTWLKIVYQVRFICRLGLAWPDLFILPSPWKISVWPSDHSIEILHSRIDRFYEVLASHWWNEKRCLITWKWHQHWTDCESCPGTELSHSILSWGIRRNSLKMYYIQKQELSKVVKWHNYRYGLPSTPQPVGN